MAIRALMGASQEWGESWGVRPKGRSLILGLPGAKISFKKMKFIFIWCRSSGSIAITSRSVSPYQWKTVIPGPSIAAGMPQ